VTLPSLLQQLRSDVGTILNAIHEYERMELRGAWTSIPAAAAKQDKAYRDIESRMLKACERVGLHPREKQQLHDLITAQRVELARRQHTINTLIATYGLSPEAPTLYLPPEDTTTAL
jgi:hypothetical protein